MPLLMECHVSNSFIVLQKANVYDILKREKLLITTASLSHLQVSLFFPSCYLQSCQSYFIFIL